MYLIKVGPRYFKGEGILGSLDWTEKQSEAIVFGKDQAWLAYTGFRRLWRTAELVRIY